MTPPELKAYKCKCNNLHGKKHMLTMSLFLKCLFLLKIGPEWKKINELLTLLNKD